MPLSKLQFKPGVNREVTSYTNEGGWFDSDKVRFQKGYPEKIGGWQKRGVEFFLGTCRALHPWVTLNRDQFIGLGTTEKYYIGEGGAYNDITPIREQTAAGAVTFAATNGSSTLVVSDTAHGAVVGDFVTFSGASTLGGVITPAVLNQEYQITLVVNANSYQIVTRTGGTGITQATYVDTSVTPNVTRNVDPVPANGSDTGNGGTSIVGNYQINIGLNTTVRASGWGAGTWSRAGWGEASTDLIVTNTLRLWSHDNFGEDLLINVRDGGLYYWDSSNGLGARAVSLVSLNATGKIPTVAKQVMVSDRDRHVIAFGCDPETTPGVQDPLTIRFSTQESVSQWGAEATNTAGELRLGSGSEIVAAVETRQQILVLTDTTLYAMQFLGPPFTFGVTAISENITVASPNAVIAVDDNVYWMGRSEFYVYSGAVQRLPCMVRDYVFSDINENQLEKINGALNTEHSEVWWFYPSASSDEVDKYVVYNYSEQVWYYGILGRTAWMDRGIFDFPIAANVDGYLYEHEFGFNDGTTNPASAIDSYIQSSPIDIGDGEQFMFINKMIPDVDFRNSTATLPEVDLTIDMKNVPDGTYTQESTKGFVSTKVAPVSNRTEQLFFRLRGRQMRFKISSDELSVTWRLGSPRVDIRPDGRR
tara:strand:- start:562 stop:2502 length:1941 start_codon:yes stop_codon:yes gene_type:complete